jgi:hypothetical protein
MADVERDAEVAKHRNDSPGARVRNVLKDHG